MPDNEQHDREMTQIGHRLQAIEKQTQEIPRLAQATEDNSQRIHSLEKRINNGLSEEVARHGERLEVLAEQKATQKAHESEERLGHYLQEINDNLKKQIEQERESRQKQEEELKAKQKNVWVSIISTALMVLGFIGGSVLGWW